MHVPHLSVRVTEISTSMCRVYQMAAEAPTSMCNTNHLEKSEESMSTSKCLTCRWENLRCPHQLVVLTTWEL